MRLRPFSWAKNKIKFFSDGKTRGPLLARAALKVFVRAASATFGRTVDSFASQMLLIFDSIFYSNIRQTCTYVVQIKRRDVSPFLV